MVTYQCKIYISFVEGTLPYVLIVENFDSGFPYIASLSVYILAALEFCLCSMGHPSLQQNNEGKFNVRVIHKLLQT